MPGLRDEITKTLLFLSRSGRSRPPRRTQSNASSSAADDALKRGRKLGPYRIVKHLGAGGMGHVYLALDTRLGRHVALKFLPPDLVADEEMLRRLEVEAQTASRLNHPNILTIYDIGQVEGEYFIASEYVDGATLRSAIERKVIDSATAIEIVSQVLSALVASHSAGVIHRDLKPGNIMIRPDGYVKVIDFGLAKQTRRAKSEGNWAHTITRPGSIVGTVDYMSPEQARGDPVDHRTDLWSVGVILYEILVHHRPFEGDTENHVIVNILDKPVPSIAEATDLPAGLSNVVQKALTKDPNERYQTAREMLIDLQAIGRTSQVGSSVHGLAAAATPRSRKSFMFLGLLLAGFAVFGSAWWLADKWKQLREPDWFQIDKVRRLTFNGQVRVATISPDGKYLAFAEGDPDGVQTLHLMRVDGASEEIKLGPAKTSFIGLSFAPDDSIYVVTKDRSFIGKLYRVPFIGKPSEQPILTDIDGPVSFSPSGDRFAFVRHIEADQGKNVAKSTIFTASRNGDQIHRLISLTDSTIYERIAWSPQGNRMAAILFNDQPNFGGQLILDLLNLHGSESRQVLPAWQVVGQLCWMPDERSIVLPASANTEAANQLQLRQIALQSDRIFQITKDLAGYKHISLTHDGSQLAAIKVESRATIWVSSRNDYSAGRSILAEVEQRPTLDWFDNGHLITTSQRSGFANLWLFDTETQATSRLTDEAYVVQDVARVPGSKSVVFTSNRTTQFKLWKYDLEANKYVQLTFGPEYDETPNASPDGRSVVYTSWTSTSPYLRRVAIEGGKSEQIGSFQAKAPQMSPDGKLIACYMQDPRTLNWAVGVISSTGKGPIRTFADVGVPFRWSLDSKSLTAAIQDSKGISNIWALPIDGSARIQLTHFLDQTIANFAWSPQGDQLACIRVSLGSDVVLFTRRSNK